MQKASIIGISRHRILRDGKGVTTLVGMNGCPLRCEYCINKGHLQSSHSRLITTGQLIKILEVDDIYFRATGGGVVFGGGEPLMHTEFISEFRELCPPAWIVSVETSLNVEYDSLVSVCSYVERLIVDIKTLSPDIYEKYTGRQNGMVMENLAYLSKNKMQDKVDIRIPLIPYFNNRRDINQSIKILKDMGFNNLTVIPYVNKRDESRFSKQPSKYGKGVCNILKYIRKTIADANGITIKEDECPMTKCKAGTCPKCDGYLSYLTTELSNKSNPNIDYGIDRRL